MRLVIDGEAHRHHVDHIAVAADAGGGFLHQVVDERAGDFGLRAERDAHVDLSDVERAPSKRHIGAGDLSRFNPLVGFKSLDYATQGVAHLDILDAAVAHLVGKLLLFGGDYVDHPGVVDHPDCSPDFRATYLKRNYIALTVVLSHFGYISFL